MAEGNKAKSFTLLLLIIIVIVDAIGMSLIYPLLAPILNAKVGVLSGDVSLGTRNFLYGLTMAISPICMVFSAPILGNLSDKIGRKKVLLLCLYGEVIGMGLSGLAVTLHVFLLLFFGRVIVGLTAASMLTAQAAFIDISDNDTNKIINMSFIGLGNTLGFIVGPLLGAVLTDDRLISWFGYSLPFYVVSLMALTNGILLKIAFNETFVPPYGVGKMQLTSRLNLNMFAYFFKNKVVRNIGLILLFNAMGWGIYMQFICLYLVQQYNFSSVQTGHFVSWIALIMSVTMLFIIRVVVRFFEGKVIMCFAFIIAITGVVFAVYKNELIQWMSVIPISCGVGLIFGCIMTMLSNSVGKKIQGTIMGVAGSIMAVGSGLAGLLVGVISSISMNGVFVFIAITWLVALGILMYHIGYCKKMQLRC